MKLFLALLLVASCQAIELFETSMYEVSKEAELLNYVKAAEEEMYKVLVKEFPDETLESLREVAHQIVLIVKYEIDDVLERVDRGSELAKKMTHDMWANLEKAAEDMVKDLKSLPGSLKKLLHDLKADTDEMEKHGVFDIYLDDLFDNISERVAYKVEFGELSKRSIWGDLNDTLHRIVAHLAGKFRNLKDFFHKTIKIGAEKLHPHLINIKKLAADLLANIGVISKQVAKQAIEFFRPFHQKLGELWLKLVKSIDARFHMDVKPY